MLEPALLATIFQQSPIGAYLLTPTAEAVVLAVNDAFLRNTGRSREQMVGCSVFAVFPADPDDPADTGVSALRDSILKAVVTRTPQVLPAQRYPIRVRLDCGREGYEERFWNAVNTPILDGEGAVACVLHTTQDVTAQIRAEEASRRAEQEARAAAHQAETDRRRLHTVVDAVPVGIVLSSADGRIQLTNGAHRALWGEPPVLVASVADFDRRVGWWADGSPRHGLRLGAGDWPTARLLRGEPAARDVIEIEPFGQPGTRRVALFSGAPVRDGAGAVTAAVVAELDITDRVRAEEALRQADRRKDEFLAMLAHELRNPLAPIGAAADLLALDRSDGERVRQTSEVIARQVRHMTALVDDLLDVSRVTRGLVKLEKERVDLKRVVVEALEQTRPLMEARRHRVVVHTPPEGAFVCGDAKRLVQVLTNLLANAAKYTPEGGRVTVDIEFEGEHVKVNVSDTGIGMSPDLVERAFELFAQAERPADRSQGGLGIGLALVKSLMELHGGKVSAASEGPDRGSRFTLCLPHIRAEAAPAPAPPPLPAPASRPLRVLVVNDNRDAATMLAMLVDTLGHRAAVEHTSHRALERAGSELPDVCMLDIGLPDIDGTELARRLRARPDTAGITLVAVTGYGQPHDRELALAAGFDHYFVKPVQRHELAALLRDIARSSAGDAVPMR